MSHDYRRELFAAYDQHTGRVDADEASHLAWFAAYLDANYAAHLAGLDPSRCEVLELGCNKGYLLAALHRRGFARLHGVDLSPGDLERARALVPAATLACADAGAFLDQHPASFDLIVLKAVLEHQPKDEVLPLLRRIRAALRPGGRVLVDVPSMDWLFASHERYMDYTHEVGFTRESLAQVLGRVFADVAVHPADTAPHLGAGRRAGRRLARAILGILLRLADPEGGSGPIWARALVATGRREPNPLPPSRRDE